MILILLLFAHWIGDFILQTRWQATNKSKNWKALLGHTSNYSFFMIGALFVILMINTDFSMWYQALAYSCRFGMVTMVLHTITDYFTSKWTARLYSESDIHNFFVVIGFDQFLHTLQLYLTLRYLL